MMTIIINLQRAMCMASEAPLTSSTTADDFCCLLLLLCNVFVVVVQCWLLLLLCKVVVQCCCCCGCCLLLLLHIGAVQWCVVWSDFYTRFLFWSVLDDDPEVMIRTTIPQRSSPVRWTFMTFEWPFNWFHKNKTFTITELFWILHINIYNVKRFKMAAGAGNYNYVTLMTSLLKMGYFIYFLTSLNHDCCQHFFMT